jgi:hypothetical protein
VCFSVFSVFCCVSSCLCTSIVLMFMCLYCIVDVHVLVLYCENSCDVLCCFREMYVLFPC